MTLELDSFSERYILCRAEGGFNDSMCQLSLCLQHASHLKAKVVFQAWTWRSVRLSDFFDFSLCPVEVFVDDEGRSILERCVGDDFYVFPETYRDQVLLAPLVRFAVFDWIADCCVHRSDEKHVASFLRSKETFETKKTSVLLVHHNCGGGRGISALKLLQPTPLLSSLLQDKLRCLKKGYVAVHVRDTDYATDYEEFLPRLKAFVEKHVGVDKLLVTDSKRAVCLCHETFPGSFIETGATKAEKRGSLHHSKPNKASDNFTEMLLDLLLLANASEVLQSRPSGFSQLALDLSSQQHLPLFSSENIGTMPE